MIKHRFRTALADVENGSAAESASAEAHNIEGELVELFAHRFLIEDAEHGVFPMDREHDRDAEVDEAAFVADAETTVLGTRRSAISSSLMTLMRERMVEWCSRAIGAMAGCKMPSMRYFTSSESS